MELDVRKFEECRTTPMAVRYSIFSMLAMLLHWMLVINLAVFSPALSAFVLVCAHVLSGVGRFLIAAIFLLLASAAPSGASVARRLCVPRTSRA